MRRTIAAICAMLLAAAPAQAEVEAAGATGFTLAFAGRMAMAPDKAWARLVAIPQWWDGSHSYSGDAARLSLDPRAGGCWCESLSGGGSVEHMRVLHADPGKLLRLGGGLGPLQSMPLSGVMTWTLKPDGAGTAIELRYAVAGPIPGDYAALAAAVDKVLAEQFARLVHPAT